MRLLVPTRISLALRMATSRPVPRSAVAPMAQRPAKDGRAPVVAATPPNTSKVEQQLWELSKRSTAEPNAATMHTLNQISKGILQYSEESQMPIVIKNLSDANDFGSIEKLLEGHTRAIKDKKQVSNMSRLVSEVLWAASLARSLDCLPPSISKWLDEAVRRLPEPIPSMKESMLWLLSIIRDDLPMLQQLQRESISTGRVGPEVEREKTLRHAALTYLAAGKDDEFRSLWASSNTPVLQPDGHQEYHISAMLHHALIIRKGSDKPDPAMLRWYADSLAANQRTPIPEKPQFETMMVPLIKKLRGRIEKWTRNDMRKEILRKWSDDYDNTELSVVLREFVDYKVNKEQHGDFLSLRRLERMIEELRGEKKKIVVVDWLNYCAHFPKGTDANDIVKNLPSSCLLIIVGRERIAAGDCTPCSPNETEHIKVLEVTAKREKFPELGTLFAYTLAVATNGHVLTNIVASPHFNLFQLYCKSTSKDATLPIYFKNYLDDAVLRHTIGRMQPVVDHSRAAQWIDKEKKELAFTVDRKISVEKKFGLDSPYRETDYYSLHLD